MYNTCVERGCVRKEGRRFQARLQDVTTSHRKTTHAIINK
jgi:hypothetical protein